MFQEIQQQDHLGFSLEIIGTVSSAHAGLLVYQVLLFQGSDCSPEFHLTLNFFSILVILMTPALKIYLLTSNLCFLILVISGSQFKVHFLLVSVWSFPFSFNRIYLVILSHSFITSQSHFSSYVVYVGNLPLNTNLARSHKFSLYSFYYPLIKVYLNFKK